MPSVSQAVNSKPSRRSKADGQTLDTEITGLSTGHSKPSGWSCADALEEELEKSFGATAEATSQVKRLEQEKDTLQSELSTAAAQLGRGHGESQDPRPRARRRRRLARHARGRDHLLSQRTDAHACVVPSEAERP